MKYDKVRKTPSQLLSLTGFTPEEFEAFVPTFEYHWNEYYSHFTLKGQPRQRISYNRKSSQLPLSGTSYCLSCLTWRITLCRSTTGPPTGWRSPNATNGYTVCRTYFSSPLKPWKSYPTGTIYGSNTLPGNAGIYCSTARKDRLNAPGIRTGRNHATVEKKLIVWRTTCSVHLKNVSYGCQGLARDMSTTRK